MVGDLGHRDEHLGHQGEHLGHRGEHLGRQGEHRHLECRALLVGKDVKSLVVAEWGDLRPTTDAVRLVVAEWGDPLGQLGHRGAGAFREEGFRACAWAAYLVDVGLPHRAQAGALQRWG